MPTGVLLPGAIGRLTAAGANAATDDKIPAFDTSTGKAVFYTPDELASGASAVDGPASSTDTAIARFDSTTGKLLQDSVTTVADTTGAITIPGTTNQLVLGVTNTTTISSTAPASSQTVTFGDSGIATAFVPLSTAQITVAEIDTLDGAVVGNTVASKVAQLDSAKALQTNANVGTAGTGVTAVEYGDGYTHVTVLTLTAAALTPTIPADAEGAGVIVYTYPAGVYVVDACHMDVTAMTVDSATNAADIGVGSLIASGDIATLTTAAMEDYVTGQTIADVSSPAKEKSTIPTGGASLLFESAGSHVAHLNIAATWNSTVATLDATATITIAWRFLSA